MPARCVSFLPRVLPKSQSNSVCVLPGCGELSGRAPAAAGSYVYQPTNVVVTHYTPWVPCRHGSRAPVAGGSYVSEEVNTQYPVENGFLQEGNVRRVKNVTDQLNYVENSIMIIPNEVPPPHMEKFMLPQRWFGCLSMHNPHIYSTTSGQKALSDSSSWCFSACWRNIDIFLGRTTFFYRTKAFFRKETCFYPSKKPRNIMVMSQIMPFGL